MALVDSGMVKKGFGITLGVIAAIFVVGLVSRMLEKV